MEPNPVGFELITFICDFYQQILALRRVCIVNWHPAVLSQTSNR